eukprot:1964427-Lingulodinium_polyedra.AAC.1
MNRHYSLGSAPWSMGIPVPKASYVPPPNLSTAMDPQTRRLYSVGFPKPPVPPPPPPTTMPPPGGKATKEEEVW